MKTSRIIIITTILIILLILLLLTTARADQEKALLYEYCGREYTTCQSDCVQINLPNNHIEKCRNHCYKQYTECRNER